MCNLYQLSPRDDIEIYFRSAVWSGYTQATVGPFGAGAFLRAGTNSLQLVPAQWGMIAPGSKTRRPSSRAILTNNARSETMAKLWTYRDAWRLGRRCLVPAAWYAEPNWETGKNVWWHLKRADGLPWALAGLWSEWVDPETGELVPSYTVITRNCDDHPLLSRLHKPDPKQPPNAQDKRSLVHIQPEDWTAWLNGDAATAESLLRLQPPEFFDQTDRIRTDELLTAKSPVQSTLL
jgi:putative SOS response-associated peptidase YedK